MALINVDGVVMWFVLATPISMLYDRLLVCIFWDAIRTANSSTIHYSTSSRLGDLVYIPDRLNPNDASFLLPMRKLTGVN